MLSVLYSSEAYLLTNKIDENLMAYYSFPWQEFTGNMKLLEKETEKKGKAFLFFPNGMTMEAFDDTFGEDLEYQIDDVPGIIDFTINAFTFKKEFRETSEENLRTIGDHFK